MINKLKISNYKGFELLELDNIGKFNLIVGDNNIGKTNLLECLYLLSNDNSTYSVLSNILNKRKTQYNANEPENNYINDFFKNIKSKLIKIQSNEDSLIIDTRLISELNKAQKKIYDSNTRDPNRGDSSSLLEHQYALVSKFNNKENIVSLNNSFQYGGQQVKSNFISLNENLYPIRNIFSNRYQRDLSRKEELIEKIKLIIPNINHIEPSFISNNLLVGEVGRDTLIELTQYGEGTIKFVYNLLILQENKNGIVLIDEIDTGIHYKKMNHYLENLLMLCNSLDIQLFTTSHSYDCINSFYKVLAKNKNLADDFRCISFEMVDGKPVPYVYGFEEYEESILSGVELRGGFYG